MASVAKRKWTRPDGSIGEKWIVRYLSGDKHKQKTFERKKEANDFRAKIETEAASGKLVGVIGDVTVAEAATSYGVHIDRRLNDGQLKRSSHRNLCSFISKYVLPSFAKRRMRDVDSAVLVQWFYDLRENEGLSARTALDRLIAYATFWKFAKMGKMVFGENPASEALEIIGKIPKSKIRILSASDVQRIVELTSARRKHQTHHSWRVTQIAVHLAAFSGLRIGEILALRVGDVDLNGRRVYIRHTINQWDELTAPKTRDSRRVVPIPSTTADLIADYLANDYRPNDRELIFRTAFGRKSPAGGPIKINAFGRCYWQPVVRAADLDVAGDGLHFHALRHFAASWWLQNRMPITEAARLLGHANPNITLSIYSHAIMEAEERESAIEALSTPLLAQGLRTAEKTMRLQ